MSNSKRAACCALIALASVSCAGSDFDVGDDSTEDSGTTRDSSAADVAIDVVDSGAEETPPPDSAPAIDATDDALAPGGVNLGTAAAYVLLAKTAISTVPTSAINGDLAVSPAAATYITGFSLIADSTNVFARSTQVTGKVFAADNAVPTPVHLTDAVLDMQIAFTEAAARAPTSSGLAGGLIGGMTLSAGVYKWATGVSIAADVTLTGSASDVWIFQIAQDLTVAGGVKIVLGGGAKARNVFFQVSGFADVGTGAHLEGVLLAKTAITMHTGTSVHGRLLSQTAITLDGTTVTEP